MDIMLIHPNDMKAIYGDTLHYTACEPPYWMAIAAQYCLDRQFSVEMIDAEAENLSFEELVGRVANAEPKLVGIFVTGTNLSASTQKMHGADLTCQAIKAKMPHARIFLWGLHPSALPEKSLMESGADYVVKGEGLEVIAKLIDSTPEEGEHTGFGGLYCRAKDTGGAVKLPGEAALLSTDDIPLPAWELLPMDRYMPHNWHIMGEARPESARGRYGVVSSSIGCPFNCSFCAIAAQFGSKRVRFWDAERVVNEIERLAKQFNVKYIKILDENFVLNKAYVNELCDLLIQRNLDLNMWAYARVDTVEPGLLKKLRRAGIKWLAYGVESGDSASLDGVQKGQYTRQKTLDAMKWTREADINIIANFMFGLPDDTMESMVSTLSLCKETNPEWVNFYVTMAYPGSQDYFQAVEEGKITSDNWIQYAQYSYECVPMGSKHLSPEEVLRYRDWAFNDFFAGNEAYFQRISERFGEKYTLRIKEMTKNHLRRKLLGD